MFVKKELGLNRVKIIHSMCQCNVRTMWCSLWFGSDLGGFGGGGGQALSFNDFFKDKHLKKQTKFRK